MLKRSIEYIESSLSIVAFIGLLAVSAVTVSALNPKSSESSSKVAGVQTEQVDVETVPIKLSNLAADTEYFQTLFRESNGENKLIINFDKLPEGEIIVPFLKLENSSQYTGNVEIKAYVQDSLKSDLAMYLEDELDVLVLSAPETVASAKLLSIEPYITRQMNLRINNLNHINFPFTIEITVK